MIMKLGANGQLVIPQAIRDNAGLHPGDEVDVELRSADSNFQGAREVRPLGGRYAGSDMLRGLMKDHVQEIPGDRR